MVSNLRAMASNLLAMASNLAKSVYRIRCFPLPFLSESECTSTAFAAMDEAVDVADMEMM